MSARNELYEYINQLIEDGHTIMPGSYAALKIGELLDRIEDNRVHVEAQLLHIKAKTARLDLLDPLSLYQRRLIKEQADKIDPYEMCDGHLVRKSDGKPVTL